MCLVFHYHIPLPNHRNSVYLYLSFHPTVSEYTRANLCSSSQQDPIGRVPTPGPIQVESRTLRGQTRGTPEVWRVWTQLRAVCFLVVEPVLAVVRSPLDPSRHSEAFQPGIKRISISEFHNWTHRFLRCFSVHYFLILTFRISFIFPVNGWHLL